MSYPKSILTTPELLLTVFSTVIVFGVGIIMMLLGGYYYPVNIILGFTLFPPAIYIIVLISYKIDDRIKINKLARELENNRKPPQGDVKHV